MSVVDKYQVQGLRRFSHRIDPETAEYKRLEDLGDKPFRVFGMFINTKGRYGETAVLVLQKDYLNLPKHLTEIVKKMMVDDEIYNLIEEGKLYGKKRSYLGRDGQEHFSIQWEEVTE